MKFRTSHQLVLASASPRRKELFAKLGVPFEIMASSVEETSVQARDFKDYVQKVALLKTQDVASHCPGKTIIGADTIVVFNDELLHKPKTKEEAIRHLEKLSSNRHQVMTAVAIITKDRQAESFVEVTDVYFKNLPKPMIEMYVQTNDPFDKAGGYGIQTAGALFIDRIEGDYNTVVGLPIASLFEKMMELKIIEL
ncbi:MULTISPECIES: Maf family protein [Ureibacillus]|uniref:dTTP/UTP pyrophosphatase n=1 Tax=Ureibacillus thermosphaericus TaxID=51173 RepID=A0A840PTD2_URETH|nr:nucleoside triphosphate pyrophosphatase [Ureibacillus thermosphaericus]MBB5149140.1 septum formation protein [Ureibacillus thermosphaericus]NKZ31904.1 septum formation protein Maf [Ureibacillus thermosphaericus]